MSWTTDSFKVIPLFCTAHPLLCITLPHPRWRRFFPLGRKEQTRVSFAELKLLFAIIMPQIGWQLAGLLSKNKKMKEKCVFPNTLFKFNFCVGDIKHIKTTENKLDLKSILRTRWVLFCISLQSPPRKLSILIAISEPSTFHSSLWGNKHGDPKLFPRYLLRTV